MDRQIDKSKDQTAKQHHDFSRIGPEMTSVTIVRNSSRDLSAKTSQKNSDILPICRGIIVVLSNK